jgi:hypothetical protein
MNVVGSSDEFAPLFPNDFLDDIIGQVFVAWDRIPKPITETLETRITKLLRHQYAYDPIIKQLPFQVRRELTVDDPESGDELGRIDLCLLHGNDEDVYFAFECKRLNVTFDSGFKTLAPAYVGEDGIGCFVSQKYSVGQTCGGMIGYVFDGNMEVAMESVEERIKDKATEIALKSSGLNSTTLNVANDNLRETRHGTANGEIAIFHLFVSMA